MAWAYHTDDDAPTQGPKIAIVTTSFTCLAFACVLFRLYVRAFMVRAVGNDDLIIVVALLGAIGYTTTTFIETKWGLGLLRYEDNPPENLYTFGLVQYIGAPFYVLGIWGFKVSLLLSYLRFFPMANYRLAVISIATIITAAHIAFALVFLFLCTPISRQWDPAKQNEGHCADAVTFYLTFSCLTIVFDALVFLLPLPVLVKAKIQKDRKIALFILFTLGLFVTVVQIIRIHTIKNLSNYQNSSNAIMWSLIETNVGIITACVPTFGPAIMRLVHRNNSQPYQSPLQNDSPRHHAAGNGVLNSWRSRKHGLRLGSSGLQDDLDTVATQPAGDAGESYRMESSSTSNIVSKKENDEYALYTEERR